MANEEWRPVIGYEGFYEVSSLGRVRSVPRTVAGKGGERTYKGRLRSITPCGRKEFSYPGLVLCRDGGYKTIQVHTLVCRAFNGPPPSDKHQVAHNDGCRDNNRPENLRWATAMENAADKKLHGTERSIMNVINIGNAKLTEDDAVRIRAEYNGRYGQIIALARKYGVTERTINRLVKRRTWKHI